MADIKHRVGGEEYGTWTIPKNQIKKGYKAERGYEIDDDLLDDMSSIKYYSYTNKDTQEVEVRRVDGDVFVGKLFTNTSSTKPNTPFTVDKNASGRIDIEAAIFNIPAAQTTLKEQTKKGMIKDVTTNGIPDQEGSPPTPEQAQTYVDETLNNNFEDNNPNDVKTKPAPTTYEDSGENREGTRDNFGTYMYPLTLRETNQDILKIDMLKYAPAGLDIKKDRAGLGEIGNDGKERKSIGSVILPIPGGIKDSNKAEWGGNSMNSLEMAAADIAMESIEGGVGGFASAFGKTAAATTGSASKIQEAIASAFTAAAIGKDFQNIMARDTGMIMNPNMELLFNGPSLRPFSFSFLLAPRSKEEAKQVVQIIRFFKQGMAPIRSQANLFLKSPHTFQLQYKHRGAEHPYLNKFKECALQSCDINYTPQNNYSTFEDGVMNAYSMTLSFQELEPVYNDDYGKENIDGKIPAEIGY